MTIRPVTSPKKHLGPEIPDWVPDAIFYQIFPDRFCNGDPGNDPNNVQPWGTPPTFDAFTGGDLQGVLDRLDYLVDLGINALWLTPIFWATSNHKYNTYDYYTIDPRFGDLDLFHRLLDAAHRRGIRIVLDGVFNHCGRGFFPFHDVCENHENSPYTRWFLIRRFPVHPYGEHTYQTHGKSRRLPKFNLANPETRQYLLDVARYWTRQGIDGWRLDAVAEVEDHTFWQDLRQVVREANPEAYLFGEVWQIGTPWLTGGELDGVTNYTLLGILRDFLVLRCDPAVMFAARLEELQAILPDRAVFGMYNMLDCHDTPRFLNEAQEDVSKLMLGFLLLLAYPGVPGIYYGDEIGLTGGPDPDNRRTMPWDASSWNHELRRYVQRLIEIRKSTPALRRGDWTCLAASDEHNTCVFVRRYPGSLALVAVNNGLEPADIDIPTASLNLPPGTVWIERVYNHPVEVTPTGLRLPQLPPGTGAILT